MSQFIGNVSAYAYAQTQGYTGTEEEFAQLMASYADVAEDAAQSASEAAQSATAAAASATNAANSASGATQSAQSASASATSASQSATAASSAVSTAQTAAQTATTKASEATQSATNAASSATTANSAADDATAAKTAAETAKTAAQQSATSAATSAQTAQDVLESIPEDYSDLSESVEDLKTANLSYRRTVESYSPYATETGVLRIINNVISFANNGAFAAWQLSKFKIDEGVKRVHVRGQYYPNLPVGVFINSDGTYNSAIGTAQSTTEWRVNVMEYDVDVPEGVTEVWCNRYNDVNTQDVAVFPYEVTNKSVFEGKKWVCIGDSLTAYNYTSMLKYHDYIQADTGITPINKGLGGTGYMNAGTVNSPFYTRVNDITEDFDVITIFGSGNDCNLTLGNVTDSDTTTICGCINTTIDNLYNAHPSAILGIIAPCPWGIYPPTTANNKMELYVQAMKTICETRGIPFLDLYHKSGLRPWEDSFKSVAYVYTNDGVHPSDYGQRMLASHIESFLHTLITRS